MMYPSNLMKIGLSALNHLLTIRAVAICMPINHAYSTPRPYASTPSLVPIKDINKCRDILLLYVYSIGDAKA